MYECWWEPAEALGGSDSLRSSGTRVPPSSGCTFKLIKTFFSCGQPYPRWLCLWSMEYIWGIPAVNGRNTALSSHDWMRSAPAACLRYAAEQSSGLPVKVTWNLDWDVPAELLLLDGRSSQQFNLPSSTAIQVGRAFNVGYFNKVKIEGIIPLYLPFINLHVLCWMLKLYVFKLQCVYI